MAQGNTKVQDNILNALLIAQAKQEATQAKMQLQKVQKESEKHKKAADQSKKKSDNLEKEHKDVKKELHQLKLQYDGPYAFEYKQTKKKAMEKARAAKSQKTKIVREKGKQARNGTKPT